MNSVKNLLKKKLSLHTNEAKIKIKTLGRPVADLNFKKITKQKSGQYTCHFTNDYYSKYNWLCGCNLRNAVFSVSTIWRRNFMDKNWSDRFESFKCKLLNPKVHNTHALSECIKEQLAKHI